MKVEDLDILRPEERIVRIGGKDIDVSFIPCGITFEIDRIMQELTSMNQSEIVSNLEKTKRAFELSIDLCAAFCSHKHPEMDAQWFKDNADVHQVGAFSTAIRDALTRAYAGVEASGPKQRATKKR
jgi:hypothetical protein